MKKVILGSFMLLAGVLGTAILFSGAMVQDYYNIHTLVGHLEQFGPILNIYIILAVIGLLLGCWGLIDKRD